MSDKTTVTEKLLTGPAHTWELFGNVRSFGEATLPFGEARELFMPVRYNAVNGKGEQREINESHSRKLRREMEKGDYTPTPISVSLGKKHREKLTIEQGMYSLPLDYNNPLSQTDGSHRFDALANILDELLAARKALPKLKEGETASSERQAIEASIAQVKALPITTTIYFDGNAKADFIHLQAGRSVDSSHMYSLSMQLKLNSSAEQKLGYDTGLLLAKSDSSPFFEQVRFDSRGICPLPIKTLCSTGSSDIATSLVGLGKLGISAKKDANWLAYCVITAYQALMAASPALLEQGKVLTPARKGGTKGSSTMLIGLGVCLAQRLLMLETDEADAETLSLLVETAEEFLSQEVAGNFAGPRKRELLGEFAIHFFEDLKMGEWHLGLPKSLVTTLSCSTFNVAPIPKPPKATKAKKGPAPEGAVVVTNEPVVASVADQCARIAATNPKNATDLLNLARAAAPSVEETSTPGEPSEPWDDKEFVAPEGHVEPEPAKEPWDDVPADAVATELQA